MINIIHIYHLSYHYNILSYIYVEFIYSQYIIMTSSIDLNQIFEPLSTWTQQTNAGSGFWSSIASSSDGTKLAVCSSYDVSPSPLDNCYIYTSTNSGVTWTQRASYQNWSSKRRD
jgi:hypothetical protein